MHSHYSIIKSFFCLLFVWAPIFVCAQYSVKGIVTEEQTGTPLEFANIVLYDVSDTTRFIAGTITDMKGYYMLEKIESGEYLLVASCVGYKTLSKQIHLTLSLNSNELIADFPLEPDNRQLAEVTIKGQLRRQYIDKASYTFTVDEVKSARYSKDLLAQLPELTIDTYSQTVKTLKGGALLILVNGSTVTDNELKMIPPDKVLRVEYYDFPPARYVQASAVANIITRSLDNGYTGGTDLSHAFTTGFANDNAYFTYHRGRNQLSAEYHLNYRDYRKRESENTYRYTLNDEQRENHYLNKNKFGYMTHSIGLKYTNQSLDNYIFQLVLHPNFETRFENGSSDIINTFAERKASYTGTNSSRKLILRPVIDGYFWKALPNESDLSFNIVGTLFHTSVKNNMYEYLNLTHNQTLKDEMKLLNQKQSLIAEVAYTKKFGLTNWNSGYKLDINRLNSDINNLFGKFDYRSQYTEQYLYSELAGLKKKFLYRISLSGKYTTNKSYSKKYNRFVFTPSVMLGYQFDGRNTIRLLFQRDTEQPSVADLSNNAQVITSDIISKGNPKLVNATKTGGKLIYTHNNRYIHLNVALLYNYTDRPFNQFFVKEQGSKYIALTKENAAYGQEYGGSFSGSMKPIGGKNIFAIKLNLQWRHQMLHSDLIGTISNTYFPTNIEAIFQMKQWMVSYRYRFTSLNLKGAYLMRDENQSNLTVRYKFNQNLSFSAGMLWLFTPSRYHSETLQGSLVHHLRDSRIWDNKTMIILGLNWNFRQGKEYNAKRTLMNQDTDAGTF